MFYLFAKCFSKKKYFLFSGRSSRKEYFSFVFINAIIIYSFILFSDSNNKVVIGLVAFAYILISLFPSISLSIRRLHDIGYSGWWFLVFLSSILILNEFQYFGLFTRFVCVIFSLPFIFFKGAPATNKYGEPPIN